MNNYSKANKYLGIPIFLAPLRKEVLVRDFIKENPPCEEGLEYF